MTKQTYDTSNDAYMEFLRRIIEGKFCHECKTFSMSNCKLCRKCGEPLE